MPNKGVPRYVWLTTIIAIVGLVAIAGAWYEISQQRAVQQARDDCVAQLFFDTIKATNERTTYTEELSTANENQLKAFQALVLASLEQPPPTESEARKIVVDYRDALAAYFEVSSKAMKKRENFPYPSSAQVAACAGTD